MSLIREMLSYPFLVEALADDMMISLYASLLGVSLVLRRYSTIGDGSSCVSFKALSITLAVGWSPLRISIPVAVPATFFLLRITENSQIKSDAAIVLISASALTLGIIVIFLITGVITDVSGCMFGSIPTISREDVWLSVVLSLVALGLFIVCYNRTFAVTFDENFAKAIKVNAGRYNVTMAALTTVTTVLRTRMIGAMFTSSLVIFLCLSSMWVFRNFGDVMVSLGLLSLACFSAGMVVFYQFPIPAGAGVVVANLCTLLLLMAWQLLGCLRGWCLRPEPTVLSADYILFCSRQSRAKVLRCSLCGGIRGKDNLWDLKWGEHE